jgi:hypothetical protein
MRLRNYAVVGAQIGVDCGKRQIPVDDGTLKEVCVAGQTEQGFWGSSDVEHGHNGAAVLHGAPGQAYNEEAFHYFLEIERKRSDASKRPFLLMLIDFGKRPAPWSRADAIANKLFLALSRCLRETDFVGWYREGRVAGAVLTQHADAYMADVSEIVSRRIGGELEKHSLSNLTGCVQVRVYGLSPSVKFRSD